jgi:glycosyltransferase involved in cell wall biosynthesis
MILKDGRMTTNPVGFSKEAAARPRAEAGLSFVIPVFNEAAGLPTLHRRIAEVASGLKTTRGLKCEVVYVDDGSRDATFAVAQGLSADGLDLQLVSLSRNFG